MLSSNEFCDQLGELNKIYVFNHEVGSVMFALGMLYFLMSLVIIYFIKIQQYYARIGNQEAVQAVIFPIFVNVLWANALVNIYIGTVAITFTFEPFSTHDHGATWAFSIMYSLQHIVTEGVAILLMQKGLGIHASYVALKWASLWGFVTLVFQFLMYTNHSNPSYISSMVWQGLLLLFYGALWLIPQRRLFRRPAVIYYARTWFLFRLLCMAASTLLHFDTTHAVGNCTYIFGTLFPFTVFEPLLMYYTLLQDSKWWQGQDIFQGRRNMSAEEIRSPLQGIDINLKSAQSLAASMDRMGKLTSSATASLNNNNNNNSIKRTSTNFGTSTIDRLESNESMSGETALAASGGGAVRLLNFAYISLDKNKQLGSGSFSRVYRGKYRQKACAVKLIFTVDLTVDVIKRIAAEAQLLSLIRHPNVVDILGVSVLPPSVCILLELCSYGSLGDVLRNTTAVNSALCSFNPILDPGNMAELADNSVTITALSMRGYVNGFNSFVSFERAPVNGETASSRSFSTNSNLSALMSVSTGLNSASNSFNLANVITGSNPSVPAVPVVTEQQIQALSLSWTDRLYLAVGCARGLAALHTFSADLCHRDIKSFNFLIDSQLNAKISDLELGMAELLNNDKHKKDKRKSTATTNSQNPSVIGAKSEDYSFSDSDQRPSLAGNEILANWAAPEVIQGSSYTQAADVYSFALVLWELLVGRVPFSEVKKQDDIRRKVLSGVRPLIPACFVTGENGAAFSKYVDLIQRAWDQNPQQRPSAQTVLNELEEMLQGCTTHLLATTDAAQISDEAYNRYVVTNANRTGSIAGDDPTSWYTPFSAFSPGGIASSAPAAASNGNGNHELPGDEMNRSSHANDMSFSRGHSYWWSGSFASPKAGASASAMHGHPLAGSFASAGGSNVGGVNSLSLAHRVLQNLRAEDDGAALHPLEHSGACHVLVLPVPPHEVVWATKAWCNMSGCELDDIIGRPLHSLPIFEPSAFVKLRSGSQRKGSLAAELEAPRSRCADLANAVSSIFCGDNTSSEVNENANATSLFFKSINGRYLHRARSCHAILNVLDASCRSWNLTSTQRKNNTFSRRIAARLSLVTPGPLKAGRGPSNEPNPQPPFDGAGVDKTVTHISSKYSIHAYPVYQRTITAQPIPISPSPSIKVPKSKSGLFGVGSLGAFVSGSPMRSPSPFIPEEEEESLQVDAEDTTSSSTAVESAHNSAKFTNTSSSSPRPAQVRAEHVSLVCILFSRLQEPSQLMVPLPPAPVLSPLAAQFAASSSGGSRSSHRVLSTTSTATSNMSNSVHRLTIGGSINPNYEGGSRHSEIALSDFSAPRSPTPGKLLDDEGRGSFYNV